MRRGRLFYRGSLSAARRYLREEAAAQLDGQWMPVTQSRPCDAEEVQLPPCGLPAAWWVPETWWALCSACAARKAGEVQHE